MSHSDSWKQKYLDLYQLRQGSIASTLHSSLAQPIVAAKNFAAIIADLQGDDPNLQEARKLAGVILEMTNQAYTATYDLMRETDADVAIDSYDSMRLAIEGYGELLRLNKRGIKLDVYENLASVSIDRFVQVIVLDWVKAFLIYLARQTEVSVVDVKLVSNDVGLSLNVMPNVALSAEQLGAEIALVNIHKQLQVLAGALLVDESNNKTCVKITIPYSDVLTVIK